MGRVRLGSLELEAVRVVDLTRGVTLPKYRVEDGFELSDHAVEERAKVRVEAVLMGTRERSEKYAQLEQLMLSKEPFDFVSDVRTIPNAVITRLNVTQDDSLNTLRCVVEIEQVRIATVSITTIRIEDPATGQQVPAGGEPPGTPPTPPQEEESEYAPEEPEEDESWLDKIVDKLKFW